MRAQLAELFRLGYRPEMIASSDEQKTPLHGMGYTPERLVRTDGVVRGIYRNVRPADAVACVCDRGGVRTVLLERT